MLQYRQMCVAAATLLAALGLFTQVANAETRALLVAEAKYGSSLIPSLKGPLNDVPAMEALLRAQGAKDITVLQDADATRTSVETAIHALGLRAKPGDWIVIYYSGHGAQAQAAVKGEESDNLDEFLVLSGFDINKPDPEQYIVDNDLRAWLLRYIPANVEVLQIADSCHSGTLNRSIDPRAWAFTPRLAFRDLATPLKLTARPGPKFPGVLAGASINDAAGGPDYLPNVVYVGAAQDDQLALEASLPVEGAPSRGLLTWALEQALTTYGPDGKTLAADSNGDGVLTVGELAVYLDSQTRTLTGQRQEASVKYAAGGDALALFKAPPPPATPPAPPPPPSVFAADRRARAMIENDPAWTVASAATGADFVWDYASGSVLRRSGDVVARGVTTAPALKGVLRKWATVDALRPWLSEGAARVTVGPLANGARYQPNARVDLGVAMVKGATARPMYATVFDLASDGTVQPLYPLTGDGEGKLPEGAALPVFSSQAVAPFGTDHVVALLTPERPDAFRLLVKNLAGSRDAARLAPAIKDELARGGKDTALSIGELYTGP